VVMMDVEKNAAHAFRTRNVRRASVLKNVFLIALARLAVMMGATGRAGSVLVGMYVSKENVSLAHQNVKAKCVVLMDVREVAAHVRTENIAIQMDNANANLIVQTTDVETITAEVNALLAVRDTNAIITNAKSARRIAQIVVSVEVMVVEDNVVPVVLLATPALITNASVYRCVATEPADLMDVAEIVGCVVTGKCA